MDSPWRRFTPLLVAFGLLCAAPAAAAAGEELGKIYPATMSHSKTGLATECGAEDVWRLKSFEYTFGKELAIRFKKATVALGRHETNVLWAVVFPEQPAAISTQAEGDGERVKTLLLRFAPSEVGRIFPAATIDGRGDPWLRAEAVRIFRHKLGWKWCTPSGNTMVVPAGICILDADTAEGGRRSYAVDRNAGSLELVGELGSRPVPAGTPIDKKTATAAFDAVWEAFDREYAGFVLLPDVDWDELRKSHRKVAVKAQTTYAAAAVIADMLSHLRDLHVWVKAGEDALPGYTRSRPLNASWKATHEVMQATHSGGANLHWGRSEDGIGYLNVHGLTDAELGPHVDAALDQLADTWALVVDLRFNGGGGEDLARAVAGRFLDQERVFSINQYRSGSKRDSLGQKLERRAGPRGPWRYESPVIVLWGQKTMSSAESLALMLAQCPQVTTMGDRSGGSSANPRRLELECGIQVNLPRWLDMDPDGNPIEHVGIEPQIVIETSPEDFSDAKDPVLDAALKRLRKISKRQREPGRRL